MKKALVTSVLLMFALGASAAGMKVLEDGHEFDAGTMTLPSVVGGQLVVKGCAECQTLTFSLTDSTHYFIGTQQVSLGELKSHVAAHPSAAVLVVTPKSQKVVSRIVAQAVDSK
jgi:hypothetical protein